MRFIGMGDVSRDPNGGYRAVWFHRRSRGYGVFQSLDRALERVGFEYEAGKYEFGTDPDETLEELMARSRARRRAGLVRVRMGRNPRRRQGQGTDLLSALVFVGIGFLIGRGMK